MKYLLQFCIIMFFVLLGELTAWVIPLPIAGSIYGLILLFFALVLKIVKLEWISDVADWFHSIISLFFIAPAVAIVEIWPQIIDTWWKIAILLVLVYMIAMITTAVTAEYTIKNTDKGQPNA